MDLVWLNSEEGIETTIRLTNHITSKYNGKQWYSIRNGRILQPELLSITYTSIVKVLDKYDPNRGTIKTFLWNVVPREVIREVKKEQMMFYEYFDEEDLMKQLGSVEEEIEKALALLPSPRRERFKMYIDGYTYREIQEVHNISKSMVFKDIELSRKVIREEFQ